MDVQIFADGPDVAGYTANWLVDRAAASTGRFRIALSGGSTPKALFELLASDAYRNRMPWDRIDLFWGDERFVPHDDHDSNFRMTREAMLTKLPIPSANIHPIPVDGTPEHAAERYDFLLRSLHDAKSTPRPLFDVTFLGLGEDGHTASLFPGVAALDETEALAVAVVGAKPQARITLTYPALNDSRDVVFLIVGADKAPMFARLRAGDRALPSARVRPIGILHAFVDRAAAGGG